MSTSNSQADAILHKLGQVADARSCPMMGGWLVYVDEVLVGQINEGEFFIKSTLFVQQFAPDLERRPPYERAKPALEVPEDRLDYEHWVHEFIQGSVTALRKAPPGNADTTAPPKLNSLKCLLRDGHRRLRPVTS